MDSTVGILALVAVFCVLALPVFVIGRRRGQRNPWAAFIPLLGVWIVLCESVGRSGWFALLIFIPTAGPLALLIWTAVELPRRHDRSRWWTLPLIIPAVNLVGYWFYAFTLPRKDLALF
jgi:hypothetical protein